MIAAILVLLAGAPRFVHAQSADSTVVLDAGLGAQEGYYARPIPLGVGGSNSLYWYGTSTTQQSPGNAPVANKDCTNVEGTLGALLQDQNSNQYVLSAGHALALGLTGWIPPGSKMPITQPDVGLQAMISHKKTFCAYIGSLVPKYTVAYLGDVVGPNFSTRIAAADAAVALVVPGTVSNPPTQAGINVLYVGLPLTMAKKGVEVQKSGLQTGVTQGVVAKDGLEEQTSNTCMSMPNAAGACPSELVTNQNLIEIQGKSGNFIEGGDSGALVLTRGFCENEPVGLAKAVSSVNKTISYATDMTTVLQQLGAVSGNIYTVVGTTNQVGCSLQLPRLHQPFYFLQHVSYNGDLFKAFLEDIQDSEPSMLGYVINTVTGVESVEDLSIPDTDVVVAEAARSDFLANETPCETAQVSNNNFGTTSLVANVGIDLSGAVAALIVQVTTEAYLDPSNVCIPATYEGVTVEQQAIGTIEDM
jgi:hypothetical protein